MIQKKIILTGKQQNKINHLLKQAKFDRLVKGLLADKTISAENKAKMVYELKKKIFEVRIQKNRF